MHVPLKTAEKWAAKVVETLRPYCSRIEIAGSIRRRRQVVHDIDLVVETSQGAKFRARCKQNAEVLAEGPQCLRVRLANGFQIDTYFARLRDADMFGLPSNFGTLMVCRTGSKEHNIYLAQRALAMNLRWHPHDGVFDAKGDCIAAATEHDVFQALGLPYVDPEERQA